MGAPAAVTGAHFIMPPKQWTQVAIEGSNNRKKTERKESARPQPPSEPGKRAQYGSLADRRKKVNSLGLRSGVPTSLEEDTRTVEASTSQLPCPLAEQEQTPQSEPDMLLSVKEDATMTEAFPTQTKSPPSEKEQDPQSEEEVSFALEGAFIAAEANSAQTDPLSLEEQSERLAEDVTMAEAIIDQLEPLSLAEVPMAGDEALFDPDAATDDVSWQQYLNFESGKTD